MLSSFDIINELDRNNIVIFMFMPFTASLESENKLISKAGYFRIKTLNSNPGTFNAKHRTQW